MNKIAALFAATLLSGALMAQTTPSGATDETRRVQTAERDHDYGWIGLLGLAGLAGLMRRDRADRSFDTSRSDVRRSA